MRSSVIVVEEFYADPMAVREYALAQRYYLPYQDDQRVAAGEVRANWLASWYRDTAECPFKGCAALIERLERITGERIDLDHWKKPFPVTPDGKAAADCAAHDRGCLWNCAFHVKPLVPQPVGEGVHNHVTDIWNAVGPDGWAGIVYLDPAASLDGGLRLWRNRDPDHDLDWMTPRDNWRLVDDIGNVFNRLVLARGDLPHSGAQGWGTDLASGRLFQTFFFRTYADHPAPLRVV